MGTPERKEGHGRDHYFENLIFEKVIVALRLRNNLRRKTFFQANAKVKGSEVEIAGWACGDTEEPRNADGLRRNCHIVTLLDVILLRGPGTIQGHSFFKAFSYACSTAAFRTGERQIRLFCGHKQSR